MPLNKRSMGHGKKNSAANTYTTGGTLGGDDILTGSLNDGQEWAADLSDLAGSATPGGSDTNVQFNDGGSFGGSADFTYDGTNATLHGDNTFFIVNDADTTEIVKVGTASGDEGLLYLRCSTGGNCIYLDANSNSYIDNGAYLGIGTTAPIATLDVSGSLVKKVKTVTNADDTFTTTDYHIHMINNRDPGVTITGTLPTAVTGKEIIVTSFILPATVSGDNQIDIESAGGDTINNLTEITINTAPFGGSADNNYDMFIFRAIDENTWVGAKMEAVT